MRRTVFCLIMILGIPALAFGGQWEGTIQGLFCAIHGQICPTGQEDPYIAAENTFVLMVDKDTWYLLPNLHQGIKTRHLNDRVRVKGKKSPKYKAIEVEALQVKKDGSWDTVWSEEMQEDVEKRFGTWGM